MPGFAFISKCDLPTEHGILEMRAYRSETGQDALAMVARVRHGRPGFGPGDPRDCDVCSWTLSSVLVRVHDQCQTSEVFGSLKCDCKQQLDSSLRMISRAARAVYTSLHGALPRTASLSSVDTAVSAQPHAELGTVAEGAQVHATATADASATREPAAGASRSAEEDADDRLSLLSAPASSNLVDDDEAVVGCVIYLMQEGRGIGIAAKVAVYALQQGESGSSGLDTVDANRALGLPDDAREYTAARDILQDIGIVRRIPSSEGVPAPPSPKPIIAADRRIVLLTNNPRKVELLAELGIPVSERRPCHVLPTSPLAAAYMRTKALRMGHDIPESVWSASTTPSPLVGDI